MKTLFFCFVAACLLMGCDSGNNPEEPQPQLTSLRFYRGQDSRIVPIIQTAAGVQAYSNLTTRSWFWQSPDSFSFPAFSLINYFVCLADSGINGSMLDSVFVQPDESSQRLRLETHLTGPDGNFYRFWVDQDGKARNIGTTAEVCWIDFFYQGLDSVSHTGSLTNWSQRASWWPSSTPADLLVLLMRGQVYLPFDSRWYAVSRTRPFPDGVAIDTVSISSQMIWPPDSTGRQIPVVHLLRGGHFQH